MTISKTLRRAYHFHQKHSCGIVGHNAECALRLAKAEEHALDQGWAFEWQNDNDPDLSWLQDGQTVNEVLGCVLRDSEGMVLASLWGIADPSQEYARTVEAELASEALAEVELAERNDRDAERYMAL